MHYLAYVYHWERDTIWDIPINERKIWVNKIVEQKKAEVDGIKNGDNSEEPYED